MAFINRLACTLNYSSLYLSSVSVCPSPTAPNPLTIISSQSTSLWLLSCISNCQCFRSLPLWLPGFRVAISLTPSLFNAKPRNLAFLKQWRVSISHVFSPPSYNFKDFQILESMLWRRACSLSRDHLREKKKKTHSVWSLHLNEHPCWFRALCPIFAYLRQNAALEQNCCLSSLCGFWKRIFILTVYFYSTWKNMPAFHFHADHRTICPLTLDLLAGR